MMIRKEIDKLKEMIHIMCRKTEGIYQSSLEVLKKKKCPINERSFKHGCRLK